MGMGMGWGWERTEGYIIDVYDDCLKYVVHAVEIAATTSNWKWILLSAEVLQQGVFGMGWG